MKNRILVIIPTYNESKNIAILIESLFALNKGLAVLIVDDNSPDGTGEIVKNLQANFSDLFLITRARKRGLAGAYKQGFDYALELGYDIIIQMDADLSHPPKAIPQMLELLDKHDLVIASRYIKGGGIVDWCLKRRLLSRMANVFCRIMLKIKVRDITSGFKCIKRKVLEKIDCNSIPAQGYAFQIELAFRASRAGFSIVEHPIIFKGRVYEQSKMSEHIVSEAFRRVLQLHYK